MAEKRAVLNVTVCESVAADTREEAAERGTTISGVVEEALKEHLKWSRLRQQGLAAIEEYYREHGYPSPEDVAAAEAQVAEEMRLIAEARERRQARSPGSGA